MRHQLPNTGDFERRFFDGLGNHAQISAPYLFDGPHHDAGPADADIDAYFRLAHAMKRAGHKRIVFHGVGKDDQFGATDRVAVFGQFGGLFDNLPHPRHAVHIDASGCRGQVDRRTDPFGNGQRFRYRINQNQVAFGKSFVHQSGKPADKIDANSVRRPVQCFRHRYITVRAAGFRSDGDRRNGYPLVDDGHSILGFDVFPDPHQMFGLSGDFFVNIPTKLSQIRIGAVAQTDSHGYCPDIQVLFLDHPVCFQNILQLNH